MNTTNTIDAKINNITAQVVASVSGASHYGVRTACVIDGEFVCIADYDMHHSFIDALELAAIAIGNVQTN